MIIFHFFVTKLLASLLLEYKKEKNVVKEKEIRYKKRKICPGNGSMGHKVGGTALGLSSGTCFERLAGVFANRDASAMSEIFSYCVA